ncbi:DUF4429 domain-containing protein [Nonomuraea rhizosphaerae]|uniref:DUF4429 domain-containing protein n=1 Tax=Nonomuraea rhizosphaerae TaxID=2665663 RepID=UPI001C5DA97A|nr:DUF4429 domain-containing protein [Nonomuraea rhizosphaerae]
MDDVLKGRDSTWVFEADALRITPDPSKAPKLHSELGERLLPYAALADVTLTPGKRGTVVLRVLPRRGADPVATVAAGQLKESLDPNRLVLPAEKETLAEYYADEMRAAVTDGRPAERFLVAGPSAPRSFKAWDGAASFDGETVSFTWFWSGATTAKYSAGDQRYRVADLEGVEWHAPEAASGSMRLKVRGRQAVPDASKDPAAVVFGLGYGATHQSLPFAAAVLAAVPAFAPMLTGAPSPARDDTTDLILKLAELRDAGVLTEQEFQSKKAELLSRL